MTILVRAEIHGLAGRTAELRDVLAEHDERYTQAISPLLARPSDVGLHYMDRSVRATADLSADPSRLG